MYLKNLTMKGFKSFADTTSIDLEPGVTVIVGPNGSGKSNVVDALAWVLGSQAPNALRSTKMDDLIFAGNSHRLPLGRAEVSLTIDNQAGTLPIAFNEVSISRVLFRGGDSEYAINGVSCRLTDIAELLSDGGVGRQQHLIVSQGQVDQALSSKPEDRRAVIEEAAGVLKYRKRKERALRRLAASEGELIRVGDIISEVARQLRPLRKQAQAARMHSDRVDELTALRLHVLGREISDLKSELASLQQPPLFAKQQELSAQLGRLDAEIKRSEQQLQALSQFDLSLAHGRLLSLQERAKGLGALAVEKRRAVEREGRAAASDGAVANLEEEAGRLGVELQEAKALGSNLGERRLAIDVEHEPLKEEHRKLSEQLAEARAPANNLAAKASGELSVLEGSIEVTSEESQRCRVRLDELSEKQQEIQRQIEVVEDQQRHSEERRDSLAKKRQVAGLALDSAQTQLGEAQVVFQEAQQAQHRAQARVEALELARSEARLSMSAQDISHIDGVLGMLLELIVVEKGYAAAVEAALGQSVYAFVVADFASSCVAFEALRDVDFASGLLNIAQVQAHAASRLESNSEVEAATLGEVGTTSSEADIAKRVKLRHKVRGTNEGIEGLLEALIGDVVVVEGDWRQALDCAQQSPTGSFVTVEGDFLSPQGWRLAGGGSGAIADALVEASEELAAAQAQSQEQKKQVEEIQERVAAARAAFDPLVIDLEEAESALQGVNNELGALQASRQELARESEAKKATWQDLQNRLSQQRQRASTLKGELEQHLATEANQEAKAQAIAQALQALETRLEASTAKRNALEVEQSAVSERTRATNARIAEIKRRLVAYASQRSTSDHRRSLLADSAEVLESLSHSLELCGAQLEKLLRQAQQAHQNHSTKTKSHLANLDQLRTKRVSVNERLEEVSVRLADIAIARAETNTKLQAAIDLLHSQHGVAAQAAIDAPLPDLESGIGPSERIAQLQSELKIMGPINPLALEEYEILKQRHEFLAEQRNDITEARKELGKVISAVDQDISSVFAAAFSDVADNFKKLFESLFPDGRGTLHLTSDGDLLTSGVEIVSRPSGKNVGKLSLLSGGERTLTALAFLFAVYLSRPSPFYVLDEVEVALDDINLQRFLSLINKFRTNTQLIMVSHQKQTMEIADCLYGVSSKPGGSSTVVSERVAQMSEVA